MPPALSARAARRNFARAAPRYEAASVLAREVARRMEARLDLVKLAPQRIVDLGCGTGADSPLLRQRYPTAQCLGIDASVPMLQADPRAPRGWRKWLPHPEHRICARAEALPLGPASVQMVWSNFMLHWLADPLPALKEAHRVLAQEGLIMFACLGPDTLRELRESCARTDPATPRVHSFIDMHDLGDMLVAAGFAEPVMDMETLTLTYADFEALINDLRACGGMSALDSRPRGLTARAWREALRQDYERHRIDGRLPATFEVVYGHAWKPVPRLTPDGHAVVRFDPKKRASR